MIASAETDSVPASPRIDSGVDPASLRMVSRRLLPFLLVLYVVAWLDRVNVGFAALQMNRALGFSAAVYGLGAGLFFLGYSLLEIPSNLLMVRVGARRWIARIMISWGILSAATASVHSAHAFYVLRFLLGVAEAGFFPGVIYYLGTWFPQAERGKAMSRFAMAMPLGAVIGGPLAGMLLSLDGVLGLAGWQWLFLAEGLPAVLLGLAVLRYLPDSPLHASWLEPNARIALVAQLEREGTACQHGRAVGWREVIIHPAVWTLAISFFLATIGSYGLQFWLPEILKSVPGRSDFVVGMLAAAPYVPALVAMSVLGSSSDRTGERILHAAIPCMVAGLGFAVAAWTRSPLISILSLTVAAMGIYSRHGAFWSIPPLVMDGRSAAVGIAFISTIGSIGGFVSPYVVGLLKTATGSFSGALLFLGAAMAASGLLLLLFLRNPVFARGALD